MPVYADELIESIRLTPSDVVTRGLQVTALDGCRVGDANAAYYGMVIAVRLRLQDQLAAAGIEHVTLVDAVNLIARLYRGESVTLVESVGLSVLDLVQRGAAIVEELGIASLLTGGAAMHLSIQQGFHLAEKLSLFVGASIIDGMDFTDVLTVRARAIALLTEQVGFHDALSPLFLLNVVVDERIDLTAELAVRLLLNPTLIETVQISAGYVGPDGNLTTWVMNTRSGAVSEYQDFGFNSFAQMGSKYLAASDTGLYELLGDDDDGAQILARLKGGYLQFGGTQLSRLKEAYIAARGEGDWVLRIITGDGAVYNYGVANRNMRSTKFHMGKGQRARYFAFELISAGQDFDLDTLEFVPIVVQRRV